MKIFSSRLAKISIGKKPFVFLLILMTSAAAPRLAHAKDIKHYQSADKQPQVRLFDENRPLNLIIEFDFNTVLNDRSPDPDYTEGQLIWKSDDKNAMAFNIKIRARGNARRMYGICSFPPLKIDFKKSETINTIFEGQNKLKLVTHCNASTAYEDYMLEEYLLYKTYNILTPKSFHARLVKITYRDLKHRFASENHYGFLLEDDDDLAARNSGVVTDKKIWHTDSCDRETVNLVTLFEYMIGNTDWWITTRHNIIIIQSGKEQSLIPVPFDFDYAGCIDAVYAKPNTGLPIKSVAERYYRGYCTVPSDYEKTIELFNKKRDEIYALYDGFALLNHKKTSKMLKYFDEFYAIINDTSLLKSEINKACVSTPLKTETFGDENPQGSDQ